MSEKGSPDPTDPADPGTDDASKLEPGESFLAPDDADTDDSAGSGGGERPGVPPPPD